jgi:hypothetical protein
MPVNDGAMGMGGMRGAGPVYDPGTGRSGYSSSETELGDMPPRRKRSLGP